MSTNTFALFGRLIGLRAASERGVTGRLLLWWSLTPIAAALTYADWQEMIPATTMLLLVLYSVTAVCNGFALVLLSKTAQSSLQNNKAGVPYSLDQKPCPLAAQLMWLSIQMGAFTMSMVSNFLH